MSEVINLPGDISVCAESHPEVNSLPPDLREAALTARYGIVAVWSLRGFLRDRARARARTAGRPFRKARQANPSQEPDPILLVVEKLETLANPMRPKFRSLAPRWLDARVSPFRVPGLGALVGPQATTAHQAALELALYVCIAIRRADGRLDPEPVPDPSDWVGEVFFEARRAVRRQDRLFIDPQANCITLDGTPYTGLDPGGVQVVDALWQAGALGGEKILSSEKRKQRLPGCGHENTLRRQLAKLPPAIRNCIKAKPGAGRWLELPPLP
jgi:hypothetical protein